VAAVRPPAPPAPWALDDLGPAAVPSLTGERKPIERKKKPMPIVVASAREGPRPTTSARPQTPAGSKSAPQARATGGGLKQKHAAAAAAAADFELDLDESGGAGAINTQMDALVTTLREKNVPLQIASRAGAEATLTWTVAPSEVDASIALPVLCGGLADANVRMVSAAQRALGELLPHVAADALVASIPTLITPLAAALGRREQRASVTAAALTLHALVGAAPARVAPELCAYLFQLAAPMEAHLGHANDAGAAIGEALRALERHGGDDALGKIRDVLPAYESQAGGSEEAAASTSVMMTESSASADGEESILLDESGVVGDDV
jgi:hypothetical protein